MDLSLRIADLVRPTIEGLGYALVRVQVQGRQRMRVQVMAEPKDDRPMDVEDCATLSRAISAVLDVEDPITGAYTLEVSSPGLDRPLVNLADFERFAGLEARIDVEKPVDGRKKFQGVLRGTDQERVLIEVDKAVMALAYAEIVRAKLVLTEELLARGA